MCFFGPRASETLWPSKGQGFLEPETLDSQKVISHLVWGPQYIVLSHLRIRRPSKKRQQLLRGGLGAALRIKPAVEEEPFLGARGP